MVEQVTTIFIVIGALLGIALGLYALAPTFFKRRLENLRLRREHWSDDDWTEVDAWDSEEAGDEYDAANPLDDAYGFLVDSRRRRRGLFGLPSAWAAGPATLARAPLLHDAIDVRSAEEPASDEGALNVEEYAGLDELEAGEAVDEATPEVAESQLEEVPEEVGAMLDIFREVLPRDRTREGRTHSLVAESAQSGELRIVDLLADARWTVRALKKPKGEVRSR